MSTRPGTRRPAYGLAGRLIPLASLLLLISVAGAAQAHDHGVEPLLVGDQLVVDPSISEPELEPTGAPDPASPDPQTTPGSEAQLISAVPVPSDPAASSLLSLPAVTAAAWTLGLASLLAAFWLRRATLRDLWLRHGVPVWYRVSGQPGLSAIDRRRLVRLVRQEPGLSLASLEAQARGPRLAVHHHVAALSAIGAIERRSHDQGTLLHPPGHVPPEPATASTAAILAEQWRPIAQRSARSAARGLAWSLGAARRGLATLEAALLAVAEEHDED